MSRKILSKIWKDPVLSQLISVGFIASITIIYNLVVSKIEHTSFSLAFKNFWTYKIELWVLVIGIVVPFVIYYAFKPNFKYDSELREVDRQLFDRIRNKQGMSELIREIKGNGFSNGPVEMSRVETLIDFLEDSKSTDFEFMNPQLNKLKEELIFDFETFDSISNKYIFGANNAGWVSIPTEWEYEQYERLLEAKAVIKEHENQLFNSYKHFISQGRRALKV